MSSAAFWPGFGPAPTRGSSVPIAEDTAPLLGVVVAFLGVFLAQALDLPILDGLSSIAIWVILASVAVFLAWKTRALLVGETIGPDPLETVRRVCGEQDTVSSLVRARGMAPGRRDSWTRARNRDDHRAGCRLTGR